MKENAGPLLNKARKVIKKDTEKIKVLSAFFGSFFTGKTGLYKLLRAMRNSEAGKTEFWKWWGEGTFRKHEHTYVCWTWYNAAPTNAEGAGWSNYEATPDNLWKAIMIRRDFWWLEESICHFCLQKGQEGRSRELLASSWEAMTPFLGPERTRGWLGIVGMELWTGNSVLPTWYPLSQSCHHRGLRGEQWMLFILTLVRLSTVSVIIS